jgi:hypothetical protein
MKTSPLTLTVRKLALSGDVRLAYAHAQACVEREERESQEDFEMRAHRHGVEAVFCFLGDRKVTATEPECDWMLTEIGV